MNKNLPRVFANPINRNINNNLDYYVSKPESLNVREVKEENVLIKINEIFVSPNHVYKIKVLVKLSDNTEREIVIVGKTNTYLLTLNGNKLRINDIIHIEKI